MLTKVKKMTYNESKDVFDYVKEQYHRGNYPNSIREVRLIKTLDGYRIGFPLKRDKARSQSVVLLSDKELLTVIRRNLAKEILKHDAVYLIRDMINKRLKELSKRYGFTVRLR